MGRKGSSKKNGLTVLGFGAKLWWAADKMWKSMDEGEYKHLVLGLSFLKYISDTFEQHRARLLKGRSGASNESSRPTLSRAEHFGTMGTQWLAPIEHNIGQSRTLACLRDTLLPKLLSGKLSVAP